MKKNSIIFVLFTIQSQSQTYKSKCFYHLATIPNVAVETTIGQKSTINFDVLASFWKSINGKPRQFYTFTPEYRYHFQAIDRGFYAGGHIGATRFQNGTI
jgi:hypothetical protein